ncbi:2Fe-2S iron-sulfur cluster binding domain-containing protein [Candidatus Pacearchaeota archaeon]|nr:2Fe-2S iron-sulfur cluster binding domain-containing protein [Candidatus Pacearchaeota archaeon]
MAEIIHGKDKAKVKDGESIEEACRKLGVPFSCEQGYCGICAINILEGEDNLNAVTPDEDNLGLDKKRRLACRCKIKSGKLKIDF